jgi:hypothetical protein
MEEKYSRLVDRLLSDTSYQLVSLRLALSKALREYKKTKNREKYLEKVMALILAAIATRMYKAMDMAIDTENGEILSINDLRQRSDIFNERTYEYGVYRIREIMEAELEFFAEHKLPIGDLDMYLNNPMAYLSTKKGGIPPLVAFKREVRPGTGSSFITDTNITTLVTFAAMKTYDTALMHVWGQKSNVIGYRGYRGSDFDCPACDEACSVVHPLGTYVFPVHMRCCCIVVPVYSNEV